MESESRATAEVDAGGRLDVVIGLGANIGSPELALRRAAAELSTWGFGARSSRLYRTFPVGGPPQPDFLNAALRFSYAGSPRSLLERLRAVEAGAGRVRRERWGPRPLDLDILWASGVVVNEPDLIVPHARLRERAFALRPLLDVAPTAIDPRDGVAYARVLAEIGSAGVELRDAAWADMFSEGFT
ncbi:MAG TPA: 2-amino-4-hydroxy-6-hydroxymethyldihydropteridine diphosphokinase [Polyangiaceae bacterium]|nr:2-amino-4-hydroxy-6-hydroxymethyldihydropteridine diphosphokinase [Polyangiaceae bacterium]